MSVLLASVLLALAGVAVWFVSAIHTAGKQWERVVQLEEELNRAKNLIRILGGKLPEPRAALARLSDAESWSDRSVSEHERDGKDSV